MCYDAGLNCGIEVKTDRSAAKGILTRRVCGKVKHLEAKQLWFQERVINGEMKTSKIPRSENPSDNMTHNWLGVDGRSHLQKLWSWSRLGY